MAETMLARLRRRLGFRVDEVAAEGGWSRSAFAALERESNPDVEDGLRLSDLYGVDLACVLEKEAVRRVDVPLAALLKGNAEVLTADARFAMTGAMSAARDTRELERALGITPEVPVSEFRDDRDLDHPRSGNATRLALAVRERLGLDGVIASMVSDVCDRLGILVFSASLSDRSVDALSVYTADAGAYIVVNTDSPQTQGASGLRATLAHEVCHLLFDRRKMRDITSFCEVDRAKKRSRWSPDDLPIERRARAFQAEFIAPGALLLSRWQAGARQAEIAAEFGLGPTAVAWQLANVGGPAYHGELLPPVPLDGWPERQQLETEPCGAVPELRRGRLLRLVQQGLRQDELSESWARELLRLDVGTFDTLYGQWMS